MLRVILSGTVSSVFVGMAGASIGAVIWDTATIPFMVASCSGFILGAVGFYRDAVRKSLRSLDRYPRLLRLHLDANFPHRGFDTWSAENLTSSVFRQSWVLRSMLVASWLTAGRAMDVRTLPCCFLSVFFGHGSSLLSFFFVSFISLAQLPHDTISFGSC